MNKRKVKIALTSLISCVVLGMASCGENPAPHVHTFASEWSGDEVYHWHAATCEHKDLKSDYGTHQWGEWNIERVPTSEQPGLKYHVCDVCSYFAYEEIPYETEEATRVFLYVDVSKAYVGVNSTKTLNPTVFPDNAKKNIRYTVSDPDVLRVDNATGILTGLSAGTSLITCYNDNNFNEVMDIDEPRAYTSYQVLNKNPDYYVTIEQHDYEIAVGEEIELNPVAHGFTLTSYQSWGSYAYKSPYVSNSGTKIKGIKPGEADIVVYATPSGEKISYDTTIHVTVVDKIDDLGKRANSIEFGDKIKNLTVNETFTPKYTIYPSDSVDQEVTFTASNDVISISNGLVRANKAGVSVLTVKTPNNKIDRMRVIVSDEEAEYETNYKNYYGELSWTDGADLRAKLHNIISTDVIPLGYKSPDNWESNMTADALISDNSYVSVLYRDDPILATNHGTSSGQWQREHAFAASLMTGISTGDATLTKGRATDFHNLYAAFGGGNGARSNKNFGYADKDSLRYIEPTNGGNYCADDSFFEANDVDKGKVARAIFYMAVMYNDYEEFTSSEGIKFNALPLEITSDPNYTSQYSTISFSSFSNTEIPQMNTFAQNFVNIVKELYPEITDETELMKKAYSYYLTTNNPSAIGNLTSLLMWNSFAVDYQEMQHNNSVYADYTSVGGGAQSNRNPFIDYPELVEYAFGSLQDKAGSLHDLRPSVLDLPGVVIPDKPEKRDTTDPVEASECNYNFTFGSSPQNLVNKTTKECSFGDLTWVYSCENDIAFASSNGLKIGTASASAGEISFETKSSLEDVEAVVLYIYCPKGLGYTYDLYVDDQKVKNEVSLQQETSALTYYGNRLKEKKIGKVKFVLKHLTSYISLKGIAVKYKA